VGCFVVKNRHGYLGYRLRWAVRGRKRESLVGSKLKDTPVNRVKMAKRARVIAAEMKAGTFDYLRWFPRGSLADELAAKAVTAPGLTLTAYCERWIARKQPPLVRASLRRSYLAHWRRYIEGALGAFRLDEITVDALEDFRRALLIERGLKLKTVRNVLGGTLAAMLRDARVERVTTADPLAGLQWPRPVKAKPDPFTAEERDKILAWLEERRPRYYPLFALLFWTGMRPGEAVGLRWSDIDLKAAVIELERSRTHREDNAPKTRQSVRRVELPDVVVRALTRIRPLHHRDDFVFRTRTGREVSQEAGGFRTLWATALRATGVRYRKAYATRHTFISIAVSTPGVPLKWVAEQCGTSVAMIEQHYGRFLNQAGAESPMRKIEGGAR
jgi:integrase